MHQQTVVEYLSEIAERDLTAAEIADQILYLGIRRILEIVMTYHFAQDERVLH